MIILGLDISTTCVGWNVFCNEEVLDCGYIKPPKKDIILKMDYVLDELSFLFSKYDVKIVVAESALQKVTGGKTTANTINKLIAFNFGLTYSLYREHEIKPEYLAVSTARAKNKLKIPSRKGLTSYQKKKLTKTAVVDFVKNLYPSIKFPKTKNENYKDWCGDIADSIIISRAYWLINGSSSNTS